MPTFVSQSKNDQRPGDGAAPVYWRVEGSLLELSALRQVGFFTWHSQSFSERWKRRAGMLAMVALRPFAYIAGRTFATRLLHALLRGVTKDRLDLLGEEYFHYVLKPKLRADGVETLKAAVASGERIVLVGQSLNHVLRPLAVHLGVEEFISNRLEFRDGVATGRLLDPIVRPRGPFAWIASGSTDGRISGEKLSLQLAGELHGDSRGAIETAARPESLLARNVVLFDSAPKVEHLSVRQSLSGKHLMLIGVTGFIGKVWLVDLLQNVPDIKKITLLIRRNRTTAAQRRFEKIVEENPTFDPLQEIHGRGLSQFLKEKIEVVEGDVSAERLGLDPATHDRLAKSLDLVVNSAGLTDFNPDLRDALSSNVDSALNLVAFLRASDHAALMHLSTCYVVGKRDGRVQEDLPENYNPAADSRFDSEHEIESMRALIASVEERAQGKEIGRALRRVALGKGTDESKVEAGELEGVLRRNRLRWERNRLTRAGMKRAQRLGWPNTYTFTKSLGESILARRGRDLPIAVVRPSIVESSTRSPFSGWNEGINTSGPLSYLLGTNFRQLPSNEKKCLDVIPVDMVCRGMTLIAAALVQRKNARMYQLATSGVNPCNMGRSIELTGLAHRKHYKAQAGIDHWLKVKFETIPVSKQRYERLSIPMQKAVISGINRAAGILRFKKSPLAKAERDLNRAEKLIELYEPFILHNEHVFECENARFLTAALIPEEKEMFAFDPESIDWWDYWINIHIPALRRWCYPLMEGRPLETRPSRQIDWGTEPVAARALSGSGTSA
ncbi:MAG: SDR family oxidoreductase [Acidobacteria bacterium]|nr:SDR family oxidoreductase [Acidobacteriota bacterium]MBS1866877.1 SDR family oxidoreductase [Acidobacteriota bacterium]